MREDGKMQFWHFIFPLLCQMERTEGVLAWRGAGDCRTVTEGLTNSPLMPTVSVLWTKTRRDHLHRIGNHGKSMDVFFHVDEVYI